MRVLKSPQFIIGTLVAVLLMAASRVFFPITLPHVTLAPETLAMIGPVPFTNTMLALIIAEVILLILAFLAGRKLQMVPSGLQNFAEAIVEFWEGQSNQLVGQKLTRAWLPLVLTVFLLIWTSNYLHFIPGFDSIGILCQPGTCPGEMPVAQQEALAEGLVHDDGQVHHTMFDVNWTGGAPGAGIGLITGEVAHDDQGDDHGATDDHAADASTSAATDHGEGYAFVPFFRVAASDLNFTLALALICFLAVEVVGFRRHGLKYITKFIHLDFSHGIGTGILNLFVGLIELISELARVISWSFRLFGNMFAGHVLMVVFMFLVPFLLVVPIFGLELFVGLIQAFVFAILILAFITLAVAPLHGDDHH